MAAACGHTSTVRLLLAAGVPVEDDSQQGRLCPTPAMTSALHGRDAVLRSLLAGGAKVDRLAIPSRWTPLMMAAASGSRTAAQLLLEGGSDPNRMNMVSATALEIAMACGQGEVQTFLARRTAVVPRFPGQEEQMDLLGAAREGDRDRVEELLGTDGNDVDDTDKEGATAIILAAIGGHLAVVKLLIHLGANMNQQDRVSGWTALMQATFYGHQEVVTALLRGGADPTVTAFNGCTALDLATLVDSDQDCRMVRVLATHTIEAEPPSLLLSHGPPRPRLAFGTRSASTAELGRGLDGGLRGWWHKFSGRFKKLSPATRRVDSSGRERLGSEVVLGNDLGYQELVPQASVFTLGFSLPSSSPSLASSAPSLPSFPHPATTEKGGMPGGGEGGTRGTKLLKTRRFLVTSSSASSSPGASLGQASKEADKYKRGRDGQDQRKSRSRRSSRQPTTVLAVLKKLQLEQHYPLLVAQEVDMEALLEMRDQDLQELGMTQSRDRETLMRFVAKLKQ